MRRLSSCYAMSTLAREADVRRELLLPAGVAVVVAAIAAVWLVHVLTPSPSESSLAKITVTGFHKTNQINEQSPGGTDSVGVYIGPVVPVSRLPDIVSGPGVTVRVFRVASTEVEFPGTLWVARGSAPGGCKLGIDQVKRDARTNEFPQLGITAKQVRQVRAGSLMILLVTPVCGHG